MLIGREVEKIIASLVAPQRQNTATRRQLTRDERFDGHFTETFTGLKFRDTHVCINK